MAKQNNTREIVNYLLTEKYSQREISRTLEVSPTTVNKINKYLRDFLDSGHEKAELANKNSRELDKLLMPYKKKAVLQDSDFELILDRLGEPNETATHLLNTFKSELRNNYLGYYTSKLSQEGKDYLKTCPYQTFNFNLHRFCENKGYSNRFIFKPGQHLEIGALPIENTSKDLNQDERSSKRDFLFYMYLPFSRKTSVTIINSKEDIADKIITSLILFLAQLKGLPMKIIGEKSIGVMFKEASSRKNIELKPIKDFLEFCNLFYSIKEEYCAFKEKETLLQQNIARVLEPKKNSALPRNRQNRIENECYAHNENCTRALQIEINQLQSNPYPKEPFVHNIKKPRTLDAVNCHVKFHHHWYSSKYDCKYPSISLEFGSDNFKLITKDRTQGKEKILSVHPLFPKGRYSTNEEDLPPTDADAKRCGLMTESELMPGINFKFTNPTIKVINEYIESKEYPQQAFKVLDKMRSIKSNEHVDEINEFCGSRLETMEDKKFSWKEFTDLIYKNTELENKKKKQEQDTNSGCQERPNEDSDIPF